MTKLIKVVIIFDFAILALLWIAGTQLTAAVNHPIPAIPAELNAEAVELDGVHGWFNGAGNASSCVLLLHGVRSDRTSMIARSVFLKKIGFSSLLIDLQAHGETLGEKITFGYRESENAKAAVNYLKSTRGCKKVAAIGISLGGAASLLGAAPLDVDALVLEAVYPTIEEAVTDRLAIRIGKLAPIVSPFFYYQIPFRLGVSLDALKPVNAIKNVHSPVLVVGGSEDQHTKLQETLRLYDSAAALKELWVVQGATHEDFYKVAGITYELRVSSFLKKYL
jgi:esterase/lipase